MTISIIHGDCRDVLPTLPAGGFDCVLTDPPYGETSLEWDRWVNGWPSLMARVVKPSGSMWVFGSFRMFMEHWSEFSGWRSSQDIVWEKHNGSGFANDRFRRVHELAVHFYRADAKWRDVFKSPQFTNDAVKRTVKRRSQPPHLGKIADDERSSYSSEDGGPRLMRSVQFVRSEHGRAEHPTQKPQEIVESLLRYACPVGGSVLDPFAGSGTTGIVAKRIGISAMLIEARPAFVSIISSRLADDAPLFSGDIENERRMADPIHPPRQEPPADSHSAGATEVPQGENALPGSE